MKKFNITATCIPEEHYMANLKDKIKYIENKIDEGQYFTINKARQYGKTTILSRLYKTLKYKYIIIPATLEEFGAEKFKSERAFSEAFIRMIGKLAMFQDKNLGKFILNFDDIDSFEKLSDVITDICMESKIL